VTKSTGLLAMHVLTLALSAVDVAVAQGRSDQERVDAAYYDFWVGSWYRIDGATTATEPSFVVTRGVNRSAFDESWRLRGDQDEILVSRAMRVWDAPTRRWMLAWINADGIFQVWEGRRVAADWYVYRQFEQEGRRMWSRQAWIPSGPGRVVRVMERSFDDGATWELRSRTSFARSDAVGRPPAAPPPNADPPGGRS
jgi:hypothetical protein